MYKGHLHQTYHQTCAYPGLAYCTSGKSSCVELVHWPSLLASIDLLHSLSSHCQLTGKSSLPQHSVIHTQERNIDHHFSTYFLKCDQQSSTKVMGPIMLLTLIQQCDYNIALRILKMLAKILVIIKLTTHKVGLINF